MDVKSFSSQQDLLAKHEVKQMLLKGGFYDEKNASLLITGANGFTGRHAYNIFRTGLSCNSYVSKIVHIEKK